MKYLRFSTHIILYECVVVREHIHSGVSFSTKTEEFELIQIVATSLARVHSSKTVHICSSLEEGKGSTFSHIHNDCSVVYVCSLNHVSLFIEKGYPRLPGWQGIEEGNSFFIRHVLLHHNNNNNIIRVYTCARRDTHICSSSSPPAALLDYALYFTAHRHNCALPKLKILVRKITGMQSVGCANIPMHFR